MPAIIKKDKPEPKASVGVKGIKERGARQTPEVLGFSMVMVVPGGKGKTRMIRRDVKKN